MYGEIRRRYGGMKLDGERKKKSSVKLQSRVNKLQIIFSILFNGLTKTSIIFHRFPSETYCTQNLINSVKSSDHEADLNLIRASNALPREREREKEKDAP